MTLIINEGYCGTLFFQKTLMANNLHYRDSTGGLVLFNQMEINNKLLMKELGFQTIEELKKAQSKDERVYWEKENTTNRISAVLKRESEDIGNDGGSMMEGSGRSGDFSNN